MRLIHRYRYLFLAVLMSMAFATSGWAQDADPPEETGEEAAAEKPPVQEPETDDIDVNDGSYLDEEEEDFRPSEEIPADVSIPFPTDI
jgi:hypothetical protein